MNQRNSRQFWIAGAAFLLIAAGGYFVVRTRKSETPFPVDTNTTAVVRQDIPSALTTWLWPRAHQETLAGGITRWYDTSSPDGTGLDLLEFDFDRNPRLRLEIFDQDQDDEHPFDNNARFWERGVGQITHQLNQTFQQRKTGRVLAAWNGLFFGPNWYGAGATAEHVAPVVLNGTPHYMSGTHRWTFGVKMAGDKPVFKTLHKANKNLLAQEFDWASGGAQCLIREGKPLSIQPFPAVGQPLLKGPVPSTPQEAGHIPVVDHIKTSRVSLGWSRDNRHLYLLFVQDPDTEVSSAIQFRHGLRMVGGWSLADLQRFWIAKGVWGAINSDGGDIAQLTYLQADGNYMLIAPMISGGGSRRVVSPAFANAPAGGSLMYFYVREAAKRQ